MKLIDEKEVEDYKHNFEFNGSLYDAFEEGVDFAEQKLEPLMIDFAEQIVLDGWIIEHDGWRNVMDHKIPETTRLTTEQLLEQFLKTKQK
jgi:hypothetical protein